MNQLEVVFSFDTTGSMYPCLTQVRRKIRDTITRLINNVDGIRIGVIAHGDYCDEGHTYVTKHLDLTNDIESVVMFVQDVEPTGGGDAPECYELVLHEAQGLSWTDGASKVLVMIGDDVAHPPAQNPKRLNWRDELDQLTKMGVAVHGVQALNRSHATKFYKDIAERTGGFHLNLDQFNAITDLVMAVVYQQAGESHLEAFEQEVAKEGRMSRSTRRMFNTLLKREAVVEDVTADLKAVPGGRFQVLDVDADTSIKEFVTENGLAFKTGRGFYEFTKTETIQGRKEIVLMEKTTGDLFAGEAAREMLGLEPGETARIRPTNLEKYAVFVQSTSANRKLLGKTRFLYEVDDWDRDAAS